MNDAQLQKIFGLIGLAMRAGKLAAGRFAVIKSLKQDKAKLILFSGDASEKLQKEITSLAGEIKVVQAARKKALGAVLGRKELAVLTVLDDNFADEIYKLHIADTESL